MGADKDFNAPTDKLEKARQKISLADGAYFASIYGSLNNDSVWGFIKLGLGKFIFMPVGLGIGIVKFAIGVYNYIKKRNQNLSYAAQLAIEAVSIFFGTLAVLGALVLTTTVLASLAPIFLTVSVAVKVLWEGVLSIYHGYKWTTSKDPATKALHKSEFFNHLTQFVIGVPVAVAVGLVMTLGYKPALIIGSAVSGFGVLLGIGKGIKDAVDGEKKDKMAIEDVENNGETVNLSNQITNQPKISPEEKSGYFYSENRKDKLADKEHKIEYLIQEIQTKILALQQFTKADTKEVGFFHKFQLSKRKDKEFALSDLKVILVKKLSASEKLEQIDEIFKKYPKAFQSFHKEKGDVEDIFEAAQFYYKTYGDSEQQPTHDAQAVRPTQL